MQKSHYKSSIRMVCKQDQTIIKNNSLSYNRIIRQRCNLIMIWCNSSWQQPSCMPFSCAVYTQPSKQSFYSKTYDTSSLIDSFCQQIRNGYSSQFHQLSCCHYSRISDAAAIWLNSITLAKSYKVRYFQYTDNTALSIHAVQSCLCLRMSGKQLRVRIKHLS